MPPLPPATLSDPRLWQDLFSLSKKEAEDRQLLAAQLRAWCEAHGVESAAVYCEAGGGSPKRVLATGSVSFPKTMTANSAEPWRRLELPGAMLLHTASDGQGEDDPRLMLLAAGVRISTLKQQLQEHSFQAKFRGVELEALYDVGLAIAATLDLEELGEEVLLRAVSLLDARGGALYLLEDGCYRLFRTIAVQARASFPVADEEVEALLAGTGKGPADLIPGATHLLAVPVEIDGDRRGFLVAADKESRRGVGPFPLNDRRTLSLFANQAAIAIENAKWHRLALEKERLEREMELAGEIQQQILPKRMPDIAGFEVIGWNRPARQVGGDYFDVQELGGGRFNLVVGDVTGKGMPAALMVSTLHSALRLLIDRFDIGPGLVEQLNDHVHESSSLNKFITLLIAELDAESAGLDYLNAGHNPGLLVRAAGNVELLRSSGLPLGLLPAGKYTSAHIDLEPGDLVCIYSDGITECESPREEEFGMGRLQELLIARRREPLGELLRAIDDAVTEFAQGQPQGDDQTVVLLRRC